MHFFLFKIPPVSLFFDDGSPYFALCTLPPKVCIVAQHHHRRRLRRSTAIDLAVYIRYIHFVVPATFTIYFQHCHTLPFSSVYHVYQYFPLFPAVKAARHTCALFYALLAHIYCAVPLFICGLFIALATIVHAPWCTACPVRRCPARCRAGAGGCTRPRPAVYAVCTLGFFLPL